MASDDCDDYDEDDDDKEQRTKRCVVDIQFEISLFFISSSELFHNWIEKSEMCVRDMVTLTSTSDNSMIYRMTKKNI